MILIFYGRVTEQPPVASQARLIMVGESRKTNESEEKIAGATITPGPKAAK